MEGFQFIFPDDEIVNYIIEGVSENIISGVVKESNTSTDEIEHFEQETIMKNKRVEIVYNDTVAKEKEILNEIIDEIENKSIKNH